MRLAKVDLAFVIDTQTERRGELDMSGLPDKPVHVRIAGLFREFLAVILLRSLPDRNGAMPLSLLIDDVDQETVHRDRIGIRT